MAIALAYQLRRCADEELQVLQLNLAPTLYQRIRLLEHTALALPFTIPLLYFGYHWHALATLLVSLPLSFFHLRSPGLRVLPTPFGQWPFEAPVGWRRTWWASIPILTLLYQAIVSDNSGLGYLSIALLYFTSCSWHYTNEKPDFVIIYQYNARQFIRHKLSRACLTTLLLALPVIITMLIAFPENIGYLSGLICACSLLLCSVVLAKYAAWPERISVPQGLLYALSLWMPPMFLALLYHFYQKAKKNLSHYLS